MTEPSSPGCSRASFSLAAGLELATGQRMLEAVGRAKVASVLFDEVVMESGLHVVEMSLTQLASVSRRKAAGISTQSLENSRTVERGTKTGVAMRSDGTNVELYAGTNIPRFPDATYIEREVAFRYVSEYHTGLLDTLAKLEADWIRVIEVARDDSGDLTVNDGELCPLTPVEVDDRPFAILKLTPEEARRLADELQAEIERVPSQIDAQATSSRSAAEHVGPRDHVLAEALAEAVRIADQLDAVPVMSSAFERVASDRGVAVSIPGAESLGFVVPNFSVLPWEAIAEFRAHEGAIEARGRLREFESEAATRELQGSAAFVRETGHAVTQGLLGAVEDLAPSLPTDLRSPILASTIGLIPVVGQYASLAVSMGDAIAAIRQHRAYEGSWVAAIFELRDAAVDTLVDW